MLDDVFKCVQYQLFSADSPKFRMDIISQNITMLTPQEPGWNAVPQEDMVFQNAKVLLPSTFQGEGCYLSGGGVRVSAIVEDPSPFREVYDPGHPDADENGIVQMPNVDVITEMVNMISATRAYEANVTAMNASKSMASKALEIGR